MSSASGAYASGRSSGAVIDRSYGRLRDGVEEHVAGLLDARHEVGRLLVGEQAREARLSDEYAWVLR